MVHTRSLRRRAVLAVLVALCLAAGVLALPGPDEAGALRWPIRTLSSDPENVVWGGFPIDAPPRLTVSSGEVVRVDTLAGIGATNPEVSPEEYFAQFGVGPDEILPDLQAFWETLPEREQWGPHVLTGPIYIEGAEPGDMLEIDIVDLDTRVPYGVNFTGPTSGVMSPSYPGWREGDPPLDIPAEIPDDAPAGVLPDVRQHLYRTGWHRGKEVAFFDEGITIPLDPFMGVMGVAPEADTFVGRAPDDPPPASGVQGSGPPGPYGGNLDVKDLREGSTLYLPVFQEGAQFFVGDAHSVQGDGEVSGTAIEHSISGTFRFTLHEDVGIDGPWAEDDDYWYLMGIDWDLDRAMRFAVEDTVEFLVEEQGFTTPKAYSFASIAVDYAVSEVVDGTQVVTGKVPKDLFPKGRRRR